MTTVSQLMEAYNSAMDPYQLAVATALALHVKATGTTQKIKAPGHLLLAQLGPASGKTRIAIATAVFVAQETKKSDTLKVVVVYPSRHLLEQDAEQWEQVDKMLLLNGNCPVNVQRFDSFSAASTFIDKDTLVFVDEIDYFMVDLAASGTIDYRNLPCKALIGLTATLPDAKGCLISSLCKKLGFTSVVPQLPRYTAAETTNFTSIPSFFAFLRIRRGDGLIVWTTEAQRASVETGIGHYCPRYQVHHNPTD